jgi:hypothetical protein
MRTKIVFTFFVTCILLLAANTFLYSQPAFWDKSQKVTSGFIDKNPSFDTKRVNSSGVTGFSFLVFERWTMLMNSNICVIKFGYDSAFGGVQYITNNSNMNRNPKIAHNVYSLPGSGITNAMIVWEVYSNGRWNIFGATYSGNAWSAPYPVDTSAGDKHNPYISFNPAVTSNILYDIVYEKNGDIIFKNFEANLKQTFNEFNLTSSEPENCRNPKVMGTGAGNFNHFVTYEKQKPNSTYGVYYKKANSTWVWTGDTISTIGNNKNSNIASSVNYLTITYDSDRSGKWGLYSTEYYGSVSQSFLLIQSPYWNYRSIVNFMFPMITNDYMAFVSSCIKQTPSATKIMSCGSAFGYFLDSIQVGDSSSQTTVTLGNGIINQSYWLYRVWMVYNKDSANQSSLYARGKLVSMTDVKRISNEVPEKFSLLQNYPNPFNPATIIKFFIPDCHSSERWNPVEISVFDITGREVQTLVNEQLQPGTYEVNFDGSTLNSGIYFYRLTTDDFSDTKRMVLIK